MHKPHILSYTLIVDIFIYEYLPLLMHRHLLFYLFSFVTSFFFVISFLEIF